jgi:hypothetical protein
VSATCSLLVLLEACNLLALLEPVCATCNLLALVERAATEQSCNRAATEPQQSLNLLALLEPVCVTCNLLALLEATCSELQGSVRNVAVGFIVGRVEQHYCEVCQRLRATSQGGIRRHKA